MIRIRHLTENDMEKAIKIKMSCWTEALAGKAENTLALEKQLIFWVNWMHTAQEHQDVRLLLGAFEAEQLLGVAFASFAEVEDIPQNGIELNGLWVDFAHRSRGISLRLLDRVFDFFLPYNIEEMVIYCPHYAPSNSFYQKFGANVTRQILQMNGQLTVDVFVVAISDMHAMINTHLEKYIVDN